MASLNFSRGGGFGGRGGGRGGRGGRGGGRGGGHGASSICTHFLKGTCKYGDKCTKAHDLSLRERGGGRGGGSGRGGRGGRGDVRAMALSETKSRSNEVHTRADGTRVLRRTEVVKIESEIVLAPYGRFAGTTGRKFDKSIQRDSFGNVKGPEYDLSPDGTFKGQQIAILQLYTGEGLTLASLTSALEKKGFAIQLWTRLPPVDEFVAGLKRSCQLWVISGSSCAVTSSHVQAIQTLVDLNKGLFIWGDNDPFNADANYILSNLTQTSSLSLRGNYIGNQVLEEADDRDSAGFKPGHLILTGLQSLFEGITIAAVRGERAQFRCLVRSSDGNVVTAIHDRRHARIMIDGGYTRLIESNWEKTAGTSRFVTNSACWLYNHESRVAKQRAKAAATSPASANHTKGGGGGIGGGIVAIPEGGRDGGDGGSPSGGGGGGLETEGDLTDQFRFYADALYKWIEAKNPTDRRVATADLAEFFLSDPRLQALKEPIKARYGGWRDICKECNGLLTYQSDPAAAGSAWIYAPLPV